MSISSVLFPSRNSHSLSERAADYVELTKPRIATMVMVTVLAGAWVATGGSIPVAVVLHAMLGTLLVAASASAFNQILERHLDAQMERTANRPVACGRLGILEATTLAILWGVGGMLYLVVFTSPACAIWAGITWLTYVAVYTPLKTLSRWNTTIGAVSGALPVIIGASAAQNSWDQRSWLVFLIVFVWQYPHFMAIAWLMRKQYARAGYRMESVFDPTGYSAGIQAAIGSVALVPICICTQVAIMRGLTSPFAIAGVFAVFVVSGYFVRSAAAFAFEPSDAAARKLLRTSLIHLPVVLLALIAAV